MTETTPLTIDKSTTALVIIDLQKGVVGVPTFPHASADVVARAAKLAGAFRSHAMPVFLVHVTPSRDGKDSLRPIADAPMQWSTSRPADWAEFVPELNPAADDFVITKRQWGAFTGTELDLQLRRRGIGTIVLCGISTSAGVESTARFAFEFGYQQIFAEDACAARSAAEHTHSTTVIFPRLGRVRTTEQVLGALS